MNILTRIMPANVSRVYIPARIVKGAIMTLIALSFAGSLVWTFTNPWMVRATQDAGGQYSSDSLRAALIIIFLIISHVALEIIVGNLWKIKSPSPRPSVRREYFVS